MNKYNQFDNVNKYHVNTEINSVLNQLGNMDPRELQEFHRKSTYQQKFESINHKY